jgi:hypothetical protein
MDLPPFSRPMSFRRSVFLAFLLALTTTLTNLPAGAKVLAEGKPSGGFFWQKVENKNGKVSYICRSKDDSKIQKGDKCEKAGAKKP